MPRKKKSDPKQDAKAFADSRKEENVKLGYETKLKRAQARGREANAKLSAAITRIEELEAELEASRAHSRRDRVEVPKVKTSGGRGRASAVLVMSDIHAEEQVIPTEINGLNIYNLDIADLSYNDVTDNFIMLLDHESRLAKFEEVVVALLGDNISGHLHDELVDGNLLAPLPASLFAADLIEAGLRKILQATRLPVRVVCCDGNHGRTTKKLRAAGRGKFSYETNMYIHLAKRFSQTKRMTWQIAGGLHAYQRIQNLTFRWTHGDAIKYNGGVNGIGVPVNKAVNEWNKSRHADMTCFGHFHTFNPDVNWCCNGSLIGFNPFALSIKAAYDRPKQTMMVVDKKYGVTRIVPVFCRDREPMIKKWYKENKYDPELMVTC